MIAQELITSILNRLHTVYGFTQVYLDWVEA